MQVGYLGVGNMGRPMAENLLKGGFALANDVQLIGFEVALNQTPPTGAPATPSQAVLSVDDIWLEALPPGDGGTDAADGATGQ